MNLFTVEPGSFAAVGDSGSLVLKKVASGLPIPVGMYFASDLKHGLVAFATPIDSVLSALNVTLVGNTPRDEELKNAKPEPTDPRVQEALRVKQQYDDFLFSLPKVIGHGVGYSKNGSHVVVIRVYVRQTTLAFSERLPKSLEGIPIEIEEIGDITVN